jgi:hypothetical protein
LEAWVQDDDDDDDALPRSSLLKGMRFGKQRWEEAGITTEDMGDGWF